MRKLNRLSLTLSSGVRGRVVSRDGPGQTAAKAAESGGAVERGRYIVESVAMCELCHTPRTATGDPDKGHWLGGGPTQLRPAYPSPILDADRASDCRPAAWHRRRFHQAADHRNLAHGHASQSAHAAISHDPRGCRGGARLFEIAAQVRWNSSPWRGGRSARPSRSPN